MPGFQWAVMEAILDPVSGAEQKGTRPVLIVSNEGFNQAMPNVTILPLTSTQRRLYPSEVLLAEGKAGQSLSSIIMAHQIRTISKQRLGRLWGYLDDPQLRHEVRGELSKSIWILTSRAVRVHLGVTCGQARPRKISPLCLIRNNLFQLCSSYLQLIPSF